MPPYDRCILCNDARYLCPSVCLSHPWLTLSRERKGVANWKLASGKPMTRDLWPHLEVKLGWRRHAVWRVAHNSIESFQVADFGTSCHLANKNINDSTIITLII